MNNVIIFWSILFFPDTGVVFFEEEEAGTLSTGFGDSTAVVVFDSFDLRIISSNLSSVRKVVLHGRKIIHIG